MPSEKCQLGEHSTEPFRVAGLPMQTWEAYAHLWQFETWLRYLVYVQLRACYGDGWESQVRSEKAVRPKANDKCLTHMPTPEEGVLSFVQLSELLRVVGEEWKLFEAYLLPRNLWEAKLQEVLAIRHRIAHFRTIHSDDLPRLRQFLRDVDHGFWRFCTSYNDAKPVLPQEDDPVVMSFVARDLFAWKEVEERTWARVGHAGPNDRLTITTEIINMPWASWSVPIAGKAGFLYDAAIYARGQRALDYRQLLQSTKSQHQHVVHICLDQAAKLVRVTIPVCGQ